MISNNPFMPTAASGLMFSSFFLLWLGSKSIIKFTREISQLAGVSTFLIGSLISALMTSIPEFVVATFSLLLSAPEMSLGNIFGSNIANMSFLPAIPLIFIDKLPVCDSENESLLFMLGAASLGMIIIFVPGINLKMLPVLFLAVYFFIIKSIFVRDKQNFKCNETQLIEPVNTGLYFLCIKLVLAFALTTIAGQMIVFSGKIISQTLNFEMHSLGASIMTFGTILPEIFLNFAAVKNRQSGFILGGCIGSLVGQTFLILSMLLFFAKDINLQPIFYVAPWIFSISCFLGYAFYCHKGINRAAGVILILAYLGFLAHTFMIQTAL